MVMTVIDKIMTLTNRFINATDDRTAREIREQLIADIFPDLSDNMKNEIANITEYNDMLRHVAATCRSQPPEIHESMAMVLIRRMRREERAQRDDDELMAFATAQATRAIERQP